MSAPSLLLVDDDDSLRAAMHSLLQAYGFAVTSEANARAALARIAAGSFDVLISDLHMPGPGDGLTVVGAMRHANPSAVTVLLSGDPNLANAAAAVLRHTDRLFVKPTSVSSMVLVIREHLALGPEARGERASPTLCFESVADVLERESDAILLSCFNHVMRRSVLNSFPLTVAERCDPLALQLRQVVARLRSQAPLGGAHATPEPLPADGDSRRRLGFTPGMIAEEARILQLSLFEMIRQNLDRIDLSHLAESLMTIADEMNAQLARHLADSAAAHHPVAEHIFLSPDHSP